MAVHGHDLIEHLLAVDALVAPLRALCLRVLHAHVVQGLPLQRDHQVHAVRIVVGWRWLTLKPDQPTRLVATTVAYASPFLSLHGRLTCVNTTDLFRQLQLVVFTREPSGV